MSAIKAIETRYAGCHFRSRLEARWAVFFDTLGIPWEYEPQGFECQFFDDGPTHRWLPDFRLTNQNIWVEVKPDTSHLRGSTFDAIITMCDWGASLPGVHGSEGRNDGGVLLLGDVPRTDTHLRTPAHPILQHHKGVWCNHVQFRYGRCLISSTQAAYYDASWGGPFDPPEINNLSWKTANHMHPVRELLADAYNQARSARFEFGRCGSR